MSFLLKDFEPNPGTIRVFADVVHVEEVAGEGGVQQADQIDVLEKMSGRWFDYSWNMKDFQTREFFSSKAPRVMFIPKMLPAYM